MPENKLPKVFVSPVLTPPVLNNEELSKKVAKYTAQVTGVENIIKTLPEMVGEDFGKYGRTKENIPVCLMWLGSTNPEKMAQLRATGKKPFPLHSPHLDPDYEATIKTGMAVMATNVIHLMKE